MGKVIWKGWATSWDQIAVPVTIVINPTPKFVNKVIADAEKISKKLKSSADKKIRT